MIRLSAAFYWARLRAIIDPPRYMVCAQIVVHLIGALT